MECDMMKVLRSVGLALAIATGASASAQAGTYLNQAASFIANLEQASGMKIAVLERRERTEEFWARSAAILCEKTGDNWCANDLLFMTSNTEPSGQSSIIQYVPSGSTTTKVVCAVIPPMADIDPTFVAEAYGNQYADPYAYPTPDAMAAWLLLYHAAHCLDTTATVRAEDRAAAFATLGLGVMQGAHGFVPGLHRVAARRIAVLTKIDAAYWAAGTAERILLDHWKAQTATILRNSYGCDVTVVANSSINIENISRDSALTPGDDCTSQSGTTRGRTTLTDSNLWIWMYGEGGLGAPPLPYTQFDAVGGPNRAAARYILDTANALSGN